MEKIIVQFDLKGMTLAQYDQVWVDLRASGHDNPTGLITHVGAKTDTGCMVIDVWESTEKFEAFGKVLTPFLDKQGVKAEPVVTPAHYVYTSALVH